MKKYLVLILACVLVVGLCVYMLNRGAQDTVSPAVTPESDAIPAAESESPEPEEFPSFSDFSGFVFDENRRELPSDDLTDLGTVGPTPDESEKKETEEASQE